MNLLNLTLSWDQVDSVKYVAILYWNSTKCKTNESSYKVKGICANFVNSEKYNILPLHFAYWHLKKGAECIFVWNKIVQYVGTISVYPSSASVTYILQRFIAHEGIIIIRIRLFLYPFRLFTINLNTSNIYFLKHQTKQLYIDISTLYAFNSCNFYDLRIHTNMLFRLFGFRWNRMYYVLLESTRQYNILPKCKSWNEFFLSCNEMIHFSSTFFFNWSTP